MDIRAFAKTFGFEALRDFEASARLFARSNTEVLELAVAENVLLFEELKTLIENMPRLDDHDLEYTPSYGTDALRRSSVGMLNHSLPLGEPALTDEQVSGFSSTRSVLAWILRPLVAGQSRPTFLVPTPCWQGFPWILEDFLGGHIERVETHSRDDFRLTLDLVKRRYERSYRENGYEPTALVLTNPGNPVGRNQPPELLEEILDWVLTKTEMHLVSDEIYAHAQTRDPKYSFVSALYLSRNRPESWGRVHVAWGFAKDFGLSGFRIGLYLCRDTERQDAVRGTAQWSPFDSHNSVTLADVMEKDGARGCSLMKTFQDRLNEQFDGVRDTLIDQAIPFVPSDASVFFWLDLRRWLGKAPTDEALGRSLVHSVLLTMGRVDPREQALRTYLAAKARVDLAPGTQFLFAEPGFFRLCYTAATKKEVMDGIVRIGAALRALG